MSSLFGVASNSAGQFVLYWTEAEPNLTLRTVINHFKAQVFSATGVALAPAFEMKKSTSFRAIEMTASLASDASLTSAWSLQGDYPTASTPNVQRIEMASFRSNGQVLAPVTLVREINAASAQFNIFDNTALFLTRTVNNALFVFWSEVTSSSTNSNNSSVLTSVSRVYQQQRNASLTAAYAPRLLTTKPSSLTMDSAGNVSAFSGALVNLAGTFAKKAGGVAAAIQDVILPIGKSYLYPKVNASAVYQLSEAGAASSPVNLNTATKGFIYNIDERLISSGGYHVFELQDDASSANQKSFSYRSFSPTGSLVKETKLPIPSLGMLGAFSGNSIMQVARTGGDKLQFVWTAQSASVPWTPYWQAYTAD